MLEDIDEKLQHFIDAELTRQTTGLELIPSENYVSQRVLKALGSPYTNKYSEGYPYKRYYGGQQNTDKVEQAAIDSAKELFGSDHANVQPHSGAPANIAVYQAWLDPGDTVMGMALDQGGHLTHGHPITGSGKLYNFIRYGVKDAETAEIDYDHMLSLARKHQPKLIIAGFSAYPLSLDYQRFSQIADEVGAVLMMDAAHIAGLIAGGVLVNPLDYGFDIMTSTTHKTLRGPRGGMILTKGKVSSPLKAPDKTRENLPTLIDREVFPGLQGGPHMNNILAKWVAFEEAKTKDYQQYCQQVLDAAKELATQMSQRGFKLIGGKTENHLLLVDVKSSFGISGYEAEAALDKVGLNLNKNAIPFDTEPPFRPSGVRLGTPAMVTRGASVADMQLIAEWIQRVISGYRDDKLLGKIKLEVEEYTKGLKQVIWS